MMPNGRWITPVSGDGVGFPDLVLVRETNIICAELKSNKGKPSKAQLSWLAALRKAGCLCVVWSPMLWDGIKLTLEKQ